MMKRKINALVVGVIVVLLLGALPTIAAESQAKPDKINEWLTTLTPEQRELFNFNVKEYVTRYMADGIMGESESFEFFVAVWQSIQEILTPEQLASFKKIMRIKPDIAQPTADAKTCYPCVVARSYADQALDDLETAQSLFDEDNCDSSLNICGPHHAVWCAIDISISYTTNAVNTLPTSFYDCDCEDAQSALDDIEDAINWINTAINQTSAYNCSPTPWLAALNDAKGHLMTNYGNALDKVEECIEDCCD
jgi:hypothetical protein